MNRGPLLDKIHARVALDREEGDIAYFQALSLHVEYITKIVTAGVVACIGDDADRHRYSLEHRLVRANAIGDWADALNSALTGPAAQFFDPNARGVVRDLTERVSDGDWRYSAVRSLHDAARELEIDTEVGSKAALRQFFQIAATIRNKTRGHGATTSEQCSRACPLVFSAIDRLIDNLQLFMLPWAYLHRNLSGKYRVSPLLGDCSPLDYLKKARDVRLPNGVFLYLDRPVYVALAVSDPDLLDILVPNGNLREGTFEALSYVTNESKRQPASAWTDPPDRLPPSETEGRPALEQVGNTFANLPPRLSSYVPRTTLETRLREELLRTDRHPIVSLTGPGGIGKTSLAIAALGGVTSLEPPPYGVIVWISARDIDLLESGPKPVSPRVITQKDIALAAVGLLEPSERSDPGFQPQAYFQRCLTNGAAGTTLFVLDNFETVENPSDVFKWIDTYIRLPNRVLITTRFRDFAGDYPIDIGGMTDDEALALIDQESRRLNIDGLLGAAYKEELIRESDGHPYVIKILLGQVAKEQRAVKPERIVASADHLLRALFERTYGNLTPAAQRVFLLLCSWRVYVPEVAVEAVLLRPGNERCDVAGALEELGRFSLIEEVGSTADNMRFVGVPLAATMYGRRKLEASPFKAAVEEDRRLLIEFGAGKREDVHRGVFPRIDSLVRAIAVRVSAGTATLEDSLPVLEYLASRVPRAYLRLADLVLETDESKRATERAKTYLRSFLETAFPSEKQDVWLRLADLCRSTGDSVGEVHALSEAALLPTANPDDVGDIANRLNTRIRELKGRRIEDVWSAEVRVLLGRVVATMDKRISDLSATGCSQLAWLYLNVGNEDRAREVAGIGSRRDPNNEHCQNLLKRLGS